MKDTRAPLDRVLALVFLLGFLVVGGVVLHAGRERMRDEQRLQDVQRIVTLLTWGAERGASLCRRALPEDCHSGDLVQACGVYVGSCAQDSRGQESQREGMLLSSVAPDVRFLDVTDIRFYRMRFSTERDDVPGHKAGREHLADQTGILE